MLKSVYFEDMPIYRAGFVNENEILLSGNKKHFYTYNIDTEEVNKITHIFGHLEERDLRTIAINVISNYFAVLGKDKQVIIVLSSKTKQLAFMLAV